VIFGERTAPPPSFAAGTTVATVSAPTNE